MKDIVIKRGGRNKMDGLGYREREKYLCSIGKC